MCSVKVDTFLEKARNQLYEEVVAEYSLLEDSDKMNRLVMYAYADALYELEDDIEALKAYVNFINNYPNEKATSYALLGAAVSLKNLDLHQEALDVLRHIDASRDQITEEIEDCNKKIKLQFRENKGAEPLKLLKPRSMVRCKTLLATSNTAAITK